MNGMKNCLQQLPQAPVSRFIYVPAVRIHRSFCAYSDVLADRVPCSAAVIIPTQYRKGWSVHFPVYSLAHSVVHGIA